jgi:hypothetical protein
MLHDSGAISSVRFGREYSPVIYVTIPQWTHQASAARGTMGQKLSRQQISKIRNLVRSALEECGPDELNWESEIEIRAWWD